MVGTVIGTIAVVLIVVAIGLLVDRKYNLLPRPEPLAAPKPPRPTHAAGEVAATAIRVRPPQLEKLREQRCAECRAVMTSAPDDSVRFGGAELLILRFTCSGCAARRTLYVEPVS